MDTIEQFNSHVMQTYDRLPLVMESGSGRTCTDEDGKRYLDFGSGIGTNSLGYCDPAWADAVCAQVRSMQHTSNYYYTKVQADFAERLCQITGYKRVFFGNSGAEANECAIKLARKYSFDKYGAGRNVIITLRNSFHGRTMATLSATGQDCFHNYFFPFPEGFVYAEANDIDDLLKKMHNNVCAVMLEYIQGEGGVVPLDSKYVDQLYDFCAKRDILVIADEVQTGVGRTGTFLAGEQYAKKADITTLAKGLGGGLPIGACLANGKCADVLRAAGRRDGPRHARLHLRGQSGGLCRRACGAGAGGKAGFPGTGTGKGRSHPCRPPGLRGSHGDHRSGSDAGADAENQTGGGREAGSLPAGSAGADGEG